MMADADELHLWDGMNKAHGAWRALFNGTMVQQARVKELLQE
jgi:hypothetical protein